jgi:hypothetical protein
MTRFLIFNSHAKAMTRFLIFNSHAKAMTRFLSQKYFA